MSKEMFLLEVWNTDIFTRRISESISDINDWINANAQKWSSLPVRVRHDGFGNGVICLEVDRNRVLYEFKSTNIAVI